MRPCLPLLLIALATSPLMIDGARAADRASSEHPARAEPTSPRPANPTRNLPSDSGAQTTLPSGAVTGAGQPQGTLPQPEVGAPGGLEPRARAADRATTTEEERRNPPATGTSVEGAHPHSAHPGASRQ